MPRLAGVFACALAFSGLNDARWRDELVISAQLPEMLRQCNVDVPAANFGQGLAARFLVEQIPGYCHRRLND